MQDGKLYHTFLSMLKLWMHRIPKTIVVSLHKKIYIKSQIAQMRGQQVTAYPSALTTQVTQMLVAVAVGRVEILKRNESAVRAKWPGSC